MENGKIQTKDFKKGDGRDVSKTIHKIFSVRFFLSVPSPLVWSHGMFPFGRSLHLLLRLQDDHNTKRESAYLVRHHIVGFASGTLSLPWSRFLIFFFLDACEDLVSKLYI